MKRWTLSQAAVKCAWLRTGNDATMHVKRFIVLVVATLLLMPPGVAGEQSAPEARAHHQLVYHAGEERAYLIGGSTPRGDSHHYFDDIWLWDGKGWQPAGSLPFPRSSHRVVHHADRDTLVLFGGGSGRTFAADPVLWEWDGASWTRLGESALGGLAEPGMCYDERRSRIVLFGGWDAANRFNGATWEWTGEAMVEIDAAGPAARGAHVFVYDPVRKRCLLYGGLSDAGVLADTWEWDGTAWTRIEGDGPSARWAAGAATDHANGRVIVFSGWDADQAFLNDTWAWDGTRWQLVADGGPPPRIGAQLTFDGETILLFGGRSRTDEAFRDHRDTWSLRGTTWQQRQFGGRSALEEIVSGNTGAMGGREAMEALDGLLVKRAERVFAVSRKPHYQLVVLLRDDESLRYAEGFDGEHAWEQIGGRDDGRRIVADRPHTALWQTTQRPGPLNGLYQIRDRGHALQYARDETIDGVRYHVLVVTLSNGHRLDYYINAETMLIERSRDHRPLHAYQDNAREIEVRWYDYRPVAGVMVAFGERQVDLGTGEVLSDSRLVEVRPNPGLPHDEFGPNGSIAAATRYIHERCDLDTRDATWIQRILDGWTLVTRAFLEIDAEPLPRTVLFDSTCAWHLAADADELPAAMAVETPLRFAGRPVSVLALPHEGVVRLPNGADIPADIIAVAMPFQGGSRSFFTFAMPELWRHHPQASQDPHLDVRIASVAFHEMIHTRQLPELGRRVAALGERFALPARFDDDVVENRFRAVPGYRELFEQERDLFYAAVFEDDPARRDALVAQALSIAQTRRERYFTGDDAYHAELENLFLNMEGVAEWVRFRHHRQDPAWPSEDAEIIAFLRGRDNAWVQDEGLALVLLLDEMAPAWKARMIGPEMASPFDLLNEVIRR